MTSRLLAGCALVVALATGTVFAQGSTSSGLQQAPAPQGRTAQQGTPQAPIATFHSAVEVVTISASVRARGGKVMRDLH